MKRNKQALLTLALFAVALALDASAASDGTFSEIVDRLTGWMTGSLGTTFALGSLAVGLAMGVVKQSVMSVVTGVAVALSASLGPNVLQGLFTATL
ncbi:hypothetical protein BSFA1_82200 (plasmid) [Burkholderia sp. SFA1]|uniref:Conjugal transfer protein TraA n=1 Tax=Burkholderia vietnamiensis (strain G4 / LMG 22486) TaxID=269482 RepID=A4JTP0_BURVG|nr:MULTISPECIES: TraA family conjugative transfer protein [Caballeronia]ABO59643.1 conserved hypothetical protein [Burkholderia vietnamiensis G4]AET95491.1 hypothetical protein BYI23_E003300 [Burkholderia sp. YI23]MCB4350197.1 hypothetical protein [Burkholderia vietnamiensis]BBQ03092.1 hypothetical protein BSFA1_82200 [Burkholderia sp. SFA1]MDR5799268.1 TraA family conjugative transfer protein [Caballeronia sp. LZ001]